MSRTSVFSNRVDVSEQKPHATPAVSTTPEASDPAAEEAFPRPLPPAITAVTSALTSSPLREPATVCERCGAEMYRMHAVWRCPACGFKTDCCGW
jgi:hypothetical protein